MTSTIADPVRLHWLEHCEGFEVVTRTCRLGSVREVLPRLETLVVQPEPRGSRPTLVPFGSVREVWPLERRLVVYR